MIDAHLPYGALHQTPNRVVVHAMGEYIKHGNSHLYAPAFLNEYRLSAHILVKPDGEVIRCRYDKEGAYHAKGYNTDSLGIEFLVEGEHDYSSFINKIKTNYITSAQYDSGIDVVMDWMASYSILNIDRHSDLSPGRKVDPGTGFNWDKFKKELT